MRWYSRLTPWHSPQVRNLTVPKACETTAFGRIAFSTVISLVMITCNPCKADDPSARDSSFLVGRYLRSASRKTGFLHVVLRVDSHGPACARWMSNVSTNLNLRSKTRSQTSARNRCQGLPSTPLERLLARSFSTSTFAAAPNLLAGSPDRPAESYSCVHTWCTLGTHATVAFLYAVG